MATPVRRRHIRLTPSSPEHADILSEATSLALDFFRNVMDVRFEESELRYQQRFDAQEKAVWSAFQSAEKAVNTALASADRAVIKAETAAEKRFEGVNEFRQTLTDQAATFLTRAEAEAHFKSVTEKIEDLRAATIRAQAAKDASANDRKEGRQGTSQMLSIAALVFSVIMGLFVIGTALVTSRSQPGAYNPSAYQAPPTVVSPAVIPVQPPH